MVPHAPIHQGARRLRAALGSLRHSSVVAVTLALLFGGTTVADAATGGNFLLGKANTETTTATLTNTKGTPLKLAAPSGQAPLAVTQKTLVKNLNAQFTGGLSAAQLQTTGGEAARLPNSNIPIDGNPKVIVNTPPLPAGLLHHRHRAAERGIRRYRRLLHHQEGLGFRDGLQRGRRHPDGHRPSGRDGGHEHFRRR